MSNIFVNVRSGAKDNCVEQIDSKHFKVYVKEVPEKGKANRAVLKTLAKYFEIPVSSLEIVSGDKSSRKIIKI